MIEWILGLIVPMLVAGPLCEDSHDIPLLAKVPCADSLEDYTVQEARFQVQEGFGCGSASYSSILYILVIQSWTSIPPLLSIIFHYRK